MSYWYSTWARAGESILLGWVPEENGNQVTFSRMAVRAKIGHAVHELRGPKGQVMRVEIPAALRSLGKDALVGPVTCRVLQRGTQ